MLVGAEKVWYGAPKVPCATRSFYGEECTYPREDHLHCSQCGMVVHNDAGLCTHHGQANADDWSARNKAACDFFHRRIEPPRHLENPDPFAVAWA